MYLDEFATVQKFNDVVKAVNQAHGNINDLLTTVAAMRAELFALGVEMGNLKKDFGMLVVNNNEMVSYFDSLIPGFKDAWAAKQELDRNT